MRAYEIYLDPPTPPRPPPPPPPPTPPPHGEVTGQLSLMIGCKRRANSSVQRYEKQSDLRSRQKINGKQHMTATRSVRNSSVIIWWTMQPASMMRWGVNENRTRHLTYGRSGTLADRHNRELKQAGD